MARSRMNAVPGEATSPGRIRRTLADPRLKRRRTPAIRPRIGENRRVRARKPCKTIPRWQFARDHAAT